MSGNGEALRASACQASIERPALSFDRVSKAFGGGVRALHDVTLDIAKGEFCVVLGPSGSGKTTLLRAVNGLAAPFNGVVRVGGEKIVRNNLRQMRRKIAMIHQHFGLIDRLTVAQNVMAGTAPSISALHVLAQWYPIEIRRKACLLVERVGLEKQHLNRRARDLSGGQRQRVGIARALISEPEIILADEPVASLDPNISREILALLRDAARERGATVLCTLHQVAYAQEFSDRIVAMRKGAVIFDGPAESFHPAMASEIYNSRSVEAGALERTVEGARA